MNKTVRSPIIEVRRLEMYSIFDYCEHIISGPDMMTEVSDWRKCLNTYSNSYKIGYINHK